MTDMKKKLLTNVIVYLNTKYSSKKAISMVCNPLFQADDFCNVVLC